MEQLAIETRGDAVVRAAQPDGAADDRIKDGLYVGWRDADDAQDLAGRCLLLQRLRQICIARSQLLEEAHVFDRDDCLVCEGL